MPKTEKLVPFSPANVTVYPPGFGHPARPGDTIMLPESHAAAVGDADKREGDRRAARAAEAEAAQKLASAKASEQIADRE